MSCYVQTASVENLHYCDRCTNHWNATQTHEVKPATLF